jgi:hypothetical protein
MKTICFILLNLLLLIPILGIGQNMNNYTSNLKNAEELYSSGKYEEAKQQLLPILQVLNGRDVMDRFVTRVTFSDDELEKIYTLLAQIYIETGEEEQAKTALVELFKESPNYSPGQLYQVDFYRLVKTVEVRPKFYGGISIGLNKPLFKVTQVYSIYDSTDYAAKYQSNYNYVYTGFLEWQFMKNVSINGAYSYSKMAYERNILRNGIDSFALKYNELIYSNELGISIKKYFSNGRLKPFVGLGANQSSVRQALAGADLNYVTNIYGVNEKQNLTKNNIEVGDLKNTRRLGITSFVGLNYKINNLFLAIQLRYLNELNNFINENNRYNNVDLMYTYFYLDNDVILKRIDMSISVGYIFKYKIH